MFGYLLPIAAVFSLMLVLYTFRNGLTDLIYIAFTHWKHTVFVITCISVGLFVGSYNARLASVLENYNLSLGVNAIKDSGEDEILATINECKKFVEAKIDGKTVQDETASLAGGIVKIGVRSYWDTCANAFGMNYWKHDIFIRGENGGPLLCSAYRKDTYRSALVEGWCSSVLAPGQKI